MSLSPNDSPLASNASDLKDQSFGGKRAFTTGVQQKTQDYKKPTGGSVNIKKNPVDKVIRDIDDMTDPKARKREFTRRAETQDPGDHNKDRFPESDPANRPKEDTSAVAVPDENFHGDRLKYHFGEGQYEGEIS